MQDRAGQGTSCPPAPQEQGMPQAGSALTVAWRCTLRGKNANLRESTNAKTRVTPSTKAALLTESA